MEVVDEKEYLYHYTSIEKLALILKNKTIRLNPLDKMDDPQEAKSADVENFGKFVLVSSWTEDEKESIPMWKMYTTSEAGVRIKLRKNPFVRQGTYGGDIGKVLGIPPLDKESATSYVPTFLDLSKLFEKKCYSIHAWDGDILNKMVYTDDPNLLEPQLVLKHGDKIELKTEALGRHKSTYWQFQNEWRYIMMFFPIDFLTDPEKLAMYMSQFIARVRAGIEPRPLPYYDLEIDSQFFSEMEITCSPQITPGNRILLDLLVEKYNPDAKVLDSFLLGKL